MSLQDVELREDRTYNSLEDDPGTTFFNPVLNLAVTYDRAVGYFRSSVFHVLGSGFQSIGDRGGHIRIVASPSLDDQDVERIKQGYQLREVLAECLNREIDTATDRQKQQIGFLGRLIANKVLDFKIAVAQRAEKVGLYHDKYGIVEDAHGNALCFNGSNNETYNALMVNSESFTVHCAWDMGPGKHIVDRYRRDFEELWNNKKSDVKMVDLPNATVNKIRQLADELPPDFEIHPSDFEPEFDDVEVEPIRLPETERDEPRVVGDHGFHIPNHIVLRDYQRDAIDAWFDRRGRGIFKMATGTGKTITSLALAARLNEVYRDNNKPLLIVVLCPRKQLVDQWAEAFSEFGLQATKCYDAAVGWLTAAKTRLMSLAAGGSGVEALVVTESTFRRQPFQQSLALYTGDVLLIADEVHNYGAPGSIKNLPQSIKHRLGLSATPERFNQDETQLLFNYFGEPIFEFDLEKALEAGALSPYRYTPVPTFLDDEEMEEYVRLARQIAQKWVLVNSGFDDDENGQLGSLLGRRSRLLGHCAEKAPIFKEYARKHEGEMFQLVYCAPGYPPLRDEEPKQIQTVLRFLGNELKRSASEFVHDTPKEERAELLRRFSSGSDLQYLASMQCLDEGVDIPDARIAFILASSRNPRQSVQRRGRILRKPSDGRAKTAQIYDFLALPDPSYLQGGDDGSAVERRLIEDELARARDFARLAINRDEAMAALDLLAEKCGMKDEEI